MPLKYLHSLLSSTVTSFSDLQVSRSNTDFLRMWTLDSHFTLPSFSAYLKKSTNEYKSYDYKIRIDGKFLDYEDESLTFDTIEMLPEDYVVLEVLESHKSWAFFNDQVVLEAQCENCTKFSKLKVSCLCRKAFYCSDKCKDLDKNYH